MPELTAVFIIVIQITALGYSAHIVPNAHVAYASEADCRKAIPAARRLVSVPAIATLNAVTCRKLEVRP